jgi:signal transduction histidine kinase
MDSNDATDTADRWLAAALAVPLEPLPPDISCARVYEIMDADEALFALPIIADGIPCGIIGRISLLRQFARPYWREVYAQRPITKLMDPAPLLVDVAVPIDLISMRIATEKKAALSAGFIVTRDDRYVGVANTIDLLKLSADHAHHRAQELSVAHRAIRQLNEELEHRVLERTAELRAAQEEILRKERLSALGQLTATVAHELRNPLSSIRNTLFTLREALAKTSLNLDRPVGRMERSIARCDGIISDLLDYTRFRDLRCRPVAADKWLEEALAEQAMPKDVTLVYKLGASGYRVNLDTERMRRVLVNLIDNAVQAMTEADAPERRVTVSTRIVEANYELVIVDTGPGIPADIMPKIFEPLFSTKSFGTGLGLPTVKQIIEQHGGTIAIDSPPARGTRVTIKLPNAALADAGDKGSTSSEIAA